MITTEQEPDDPRGGWKGGTIVKVNGELWCIFTHETDKRRVEKFVELLLAREDEASSIMTEYQQKVAYNSACAEVGRPGKHWPVFKERERLQRDLQKAAGIVDS